MPTDIADAIFSNRKKSRLDDEDYSNDPLHYPKTLEDFTRIAFDNDQYAKSHPESLPGYEEEMSPSQKAISQVFLPEGLSSSGRNMMAGGYREKFQDNLPSEKEFAELGTGSPGLRAGGSFAGGQTEGFGALPRGMDEVSSGGGAWRPPTKKTTVPQYADLGMAIAAATKRSRLGKTQEELPESELAQGLGMKVDPMLPLGSPERINQAFSSGGSEAALAWDQLKAAGIDPRFAAFGDLAKTPQERAMDSMLALEKERLDLERYRIEMAKEQARQEGDVAQMYRLTAMEAQNQRAKQALDAQERMATSGNQSRESVARINAETEDKRHQRDLDSRKPTPEDLDLKRAHIGKLQAETAALGQVKPGQQATLDQKKSEYEINAMSKGQKEVADLVAKGVEPQEAAKRVLQANRPLFEKMKISLKPEDLLAGVTGQTTDEIAPQMGYENKDAMVKSLREEIVSRAYDKTDPAPDILKGLGFLYSYPRKKVSTWNTDENLFELYKKEGETGIKNRIMEVMRIKRIPMNLLNELSYEIMASPE